jgi:ribosome maturation factor RimP
MAGGNIVSKVTEYLEPILKENQCELFDLTFAKEGANWFLRIFIDKEDGVNINDCEAVSRAIDAVLDEKDFIAHSYMLEVSSPGADRPLRKQEEFDKFTGEIVDIKLYKSIDKRKEFSGKLIGLIGNDISIEEEGIVLNFPKETVAICKLAVFF